MDSSHDPRRGTLEPSIPGFLGRVLGPADPEFDRARRVANGVIDRHPALIARPLDAADVAGALAFGRAAGLRIAVRAGGHNAAGHGTGDGVLVVDLSAMKGIEIDPVARTVWVESGVVAGELTRAANEHGLAVPFGDTGSVGAAGITLGGGIGWLARKYGMTIDSLLAAELVTADGRRLVASEDESPDLFWALRGGGGNFGIVTRLRYRLHPIGDVLHGDIVLPATRDVLRRLVPTLLAAPDDLTAMPYVAAAPPDPSTPDELRATLLLHLQVLWAGSPEEGERALAPLRALAPAVEDTVTLKPYPEVYPDRAPDPDAPPMGWAMRSAFIDAFDDAVIDIVEHRLAEPTTPWALVQLRVLGGAVGRVAGDATAYGWRDRTVLAWLITPFTDLANAAGHEDWTADFQADLLRHGSGAYVNFMGNEPTAAATAYPATTWDRLRAIKRRYDPDNVFRSNTNIPPA